MSTRHLASCLAVALLALLAVAPAAPAAPSVFWSNEDGDSIGYVGLDGSGGGALAAGSASLDAPAGVAIDAAAGKLYWANANGNTIAWAALDGSGGGDLGIDGVSVFSPSGIAIDPAAGKLYWANGASISRANLDGSGGGDIPTGSATVVEPSGVAVDPSAGRVYWASTGGGAEGKGAISYANLDGSGGADLATGSATVDVPSGIAVHEGRVYWANIAGIASAATDGSGGGDLNTSPLSVATGVGIAIDPGAGRLYWANGEADTVASAALGGSGGAGAVLNLAGAPADAPGFPALLKGPLGTAAPALSQEGDALSCSAGGWAGDLSGVFLSRAPRELRHEWLRSGEVVAGQRESTLTPGAGGLYRCRVTAVNAAGSAAQLSAGVEVGLSLKAFVPKRQNAGRLRLRAGCLALPCTVRVSGYAKVFGKGKKKGRLRSVRRRFRLRPRSVNIGARSTRLIKVRFKSNRTSLRKIKKLTRRAPKKLRKRSRLFLTLVATDAGGQRTKLARRAALIP